jgi:hypothetical protein
MNNPLQRFKFLPWLSLFQVAALTVFFALVFDMLLAITFVRITSLQPFFEAILSLPWGMIVGLAIAVGVGALAVYLLERLHSDIVLNATILWTLVLCVVVVLVVKSLLPLPTFLVGIDQTALIGVVLGVFWKGRPYWRR